MPFHRAHELLVAIRTLAKTQPNATSRRIVGLVENAILSSDQEEPADQADGSASETPLTLNELLQGLPGAKLAFSDVHNEIETDRSRRSIFLDPEENALSSLIDLYAGNVATLEIRSKEEVDFRLLRERARLCAVDFRLFL